MQSKKKNVNRPQETYQHVQLYSFIISHVFGMCSRFFFLCVCVCVCDFEFCFVYFHCVVCMLVCVWVWLQETVMNKQIMISLNKNTSQYTQSINLKTPHILQTLQHDDEKAIFISSACMHVTRRHTCRVCAVVCKSMYAGQLLPCRKIHTAIFVA